MNKNYRSLLVLLVIFLFSFAIRIPFVNVPLFRDEGLYGFIAQVLHRGGTPYRDIEDLHMPGTCFWDYIAQMLFGWGSGPGLRILASLLCLAVIPVLYGMAVRMKSLNAGLYAALYFGLLSMNTSLFCFTSLSEVYLLFPVSAAFLMFFKGQQSEGRERDFSFLLCGICLGISFWIKQAGLLFAATLIICQLSEYSKNRDRKELRSIFLCFTGLLIPSLIILSYFVLKGCLKEFYVYTLLFGSINAQTFPDDITGGSLQRMLCSFYAVFIDNKAVLFLTLLSLIYWAGGDREAGKERLILILWFLTSILTTCISRRYSNYYFSLLLPPLCLSAGLASQLLLKQAKRVRYLFLLLFGSFLAAYLVYLYPYAFKYTPLESAKLIFSDENCIWAQRVSHYIRENSGEDDPIYQWGVEWQVYFYSRRVSASRHFNLYTIIQLASVKEQKTAGKLLKLYQDQMIMDFKKRLPLFFILSLPNLKISYQTQEVYITAFMDHCLKSYYRYDRSIGPYDIFRLKVPHQRYEEPGWGSPTPPVAPPVKEQRKQ